MQKTLVSATETENKGTLVAFNRNLAECMEAVGMILASAMDNMAQSGAPMEYIVEKITACIIYGIDRGMELVKECEQ